MRACLVLPAFVSLLLPFPALQTDIRKISAFMLHEENTVYKYSLLYCIYKQYKEEANERGCFGSDRRPRCFIGSIFVVIAFCQFPIN